MGTVAETAAAGLLSQSRRAQRLSARSSRRFTGRRLPSLSSSHVRSDVARSQPAIIPALRVGLTHPYLSTRKIGALSLRLYVLCVYANVACLGSLAVVQKVTEG